MKVLNSGGHYIVGYKTSVVYFRITTDHGTQIENLYHHEDHEDHEGHEVLKLFTSFLRAFRGKK
jgi:hypothetical protein